MDNATLITIISTVIGTGATVITLNMIFILKFIKEPLDKKIDRLEDNLQSQINNVDKKIDRLEDNLQSQINNVDEKIDRLEDNLQSQINKLEDNLQSQINKLEDNLQSQINNVDRKVDKLYELLLAYHMNGNE